jgi:hypothetical protein
MLATDSVLANKGVDVILIEAAARTEDMAQLLTKYGKNKRVILQPEKENKYCAWGMNQGIKEALKRDYDVITVMNNDATVDPGYFKEIEILLNEGEVGIIQPKTMFGNTDTIYSAGCRRNVLGLPTIRGFGELDKGQHDNVGTEYASMVVCTIHADVFKDIGLLDEDYIMYLDDIDFSIRAKKAGWLIAYAPTAIARHHVLSAVGQTSSKQSAWVRQLTERNLLLLAKKNGYLTLTYIIADLIHAAKVCICSPMEIPAVVKGQLWFWGRE